jgi:hypothetical protein
MNGPVQGVSPAFAYLIQNIVVLFPQHLIPPLFVLNLWLMFEKGSHFVKSVIPNCSKVFFELLLEVRVVVLL